MTEQPILITSVTSQSIDKHYFISASGNFCSADDLPLGVVNADTLEGEQCPVIVNGIAIVLTGGAIAIGNSVQSDDDSQAVVCTVASLSRGIALDAATSANQLIRILLT